MTIPRLLALYGGPDQLMPITSSVATIFAFLMIFWNKAVGCIGRIATRFRYKNKDTCTTTNSASHCKPSDAAADSHSTTPA